MPSSVFTIGMLSSPNAAYSSRLLSRVELIGPPYPVLLPLSLLVTSASAAAFGILRRRDPLEVASLAAVTPAYAVAHGAGMWRGLWALATAR